MVVGQCDTTIGAIHEDRQDMGTLLLSRIQFAANIGFHILFPTINIALCWFPVYFRQRRNAAAKGTPEARGWGEAYYL
jgi:cytochrome d ubiquinol oxidase subunit I